VAATPARSNTPYTLLYRPSSTAATNSANFGSGWRGMTYENSETVGTTPTTVYTARAQRFFNGEVIRVQADGQICGMTFPAAADRTNPVGHSAAGGRELRAGLANATATFRWGGVLEDTSSGDFCNGMISRVSLVPCDLRPRPDPAPTVRLARNEFRSTRRACRPGADRPRDEHRDTGTGKDGVVGPPTRLSWPGA
jgi:hypothetical protein